MLNDPRVVLWRLGLRSLLFYRVSKSDEEACVAWPSLDRMRIVVAVETYKAREGKM